MRHIMRPFIVVDGGERVCGFTLAGACVCVVCVSAETMRDEDNVCERLRTHTRAHTPGSAYIVYCYCMF